MRIGILGTGTVAGALGTLWATAGHDVVLGSRTPEAARGQRALEDVRGPGPTVVGLRAALAHGEVVVNATPGAESLPVLAEAGAAEAAASGKPLVDVAIVCIAGESESQPDTPPSSAASPSHHGGGSLGEEIQRAFPGLRVVKTLCTVTAAVMADPSRLERSGTLFLSGDDEAAKLTVGGLLDDLGWPPAARLDLGGIATARVQEHLARAVPGLAEALGSSAFTLQVVGAAEGERPEFGASRTARRCHAYDACVAYYRDLVGLPVLFLKADGPDGHGVAIFGMPAADTTFELIPAPEPVPVDPHEQLVLYYPGRAARDAVARRLTAAGHEPVAQNRYWTLNDAVTFRDPEGRELVLAPWVFGQSPPPASARAAAPDTTSPPAAGA